MKILVSGLLPTSAFKQVGKQGWADFIHRGLWLHHHGCPPGPYWRHCQGWCHHCCHIFQNIFKLYPWPHLPKCPPVCNILSIFMLSHITNIDMCCVTVYMYISSCCRLQSGTKRTTFWCTIRRCQYQRYHSLPTFKIRMPYFDIGVNYLLLKIAIVLKNDCNYIEGRHTNDPANGASVPHPWVTNFLV